MAGSTVPGMGILLLESTTACGGGGGEYEHSEAHRLFWLKEVSHGLSQRFGAVAFASEAERQDLWVIGGARQHIHRFVGYVTRMVGIQLTPA